MAAAIEQARTLITIGMWPVRLKPQPDEMLSSWLVRLIAAHGASTHTFCQQVWPGKPIWTRDVDTFADPQVINKLSCLTGTSLRCAFATTLQAYSGRLAESVNKNGYTAWVLATGRYHRVQRRHALQYCPTCLHTDHRQYFRRVWRLACTTVCIKHQSVLFDECVHCKSNLTLYRLGIDQKHRFICGQCWYPLETARSKLVRAPYVLLDFTHRIQKGLKTGWVSYQHSTVYTLAFMKGLRLFVTALWHPVNGRRLRELASRLIERNSTEKMWASVQQLEVSRLSARLVLMHMLAGLMTEPIDVLQTRCRDARIWSTQLNRHNHYVPYWLSLLVGSLAQYAYTPSSQEVKSCAEYIARRKSKVRRYEINKMMGYDVFRKNRRLDTWFTKQYPP